MIIPSNSMQFNAIQSNSKQFNAIQSNSKQYNAIQCNPKQFNAIQSNLLAGPPRPRLVPLIGRCNSMQFKAIQCNSMQFNAIQSNSMQFNDNSMIIQWEFNDNSMKFLAGPPRRRLVPLIPPGAVWSRSSVAAIQCNSKQFNAIQCNSMQFKTIQCNSMIIPW